MKKVLAISAVSALLLTACGGDSRPEKERYLDVITEMTCLVFNTDDLMDPALEGEVKQIFEDHGFETDEQSMIDLSNRFKGDVDVEATANAALQTCAGDVLNALKGDVTAEEVTEDPAMTDESATSVEDASEVPAEEAPAAE